MGGNPETIELAVERAEYELPARAVSGCRDLEPALFAPLNWPPLPATLPRGMTSTPGIDAAVERSDLVQAGAGRQRSVRMPVRLRRGSGGRPYIDHPVAVAELLAEQRSAMR